MSNVCEVKRGRGRPLKGDKFDRRMEIRMKSPEVDMLNEIMEETELTKSEIVREAIGYYYDHRTEC